MATFDTMSLLTPGGVGSAGAGAVLYLARPARQSRVVRLPPNVEVEVRVGSPALVVRGMAGDTYQAVRELALEQAHRALDLLAIEGTASLALADPDVKHVVVWTAAGTTRLRIWSTTTLPMSMTISGSLTVSGSSGHPPPPLQQWDESFRYFRHSQTTDDLFDAFRNMYLALESVLSVLAPVTVRKPGLLGRIRAAVTGQPATPGREGENRWLARALATAHARVPLNPFLLSKSLKSNPVKKLTRELRAVRNGVFHAKRGAAARLPYGATSRGDVAEVLTRVGRLYVALTAKVLGTHFGSGGWTQHAFGLMVDGVSPQTVHITDDPTPGTSEDTAVNPGGGKVMALKSWRDSALDEPFFRAVRGEATGPDVMAQVGSIRRIGTTHAGRLALFESLERQLSLEHVGVVEVVFGIRGLNVQALKNRYSS
jgi:hypothetical protein